MCILGDIKILLSLSRGMYNSFPRIQRPKKTVREGNDCYGEGWKGKKKGGKERGWDGKGKLRKERGR